MYEQDACRIICVQNNRSFIFFTVVTFDWRKLLTSTPLCSAKSRRGAVILQNLKDENYGSRGYMAKDIEGHHWYFGT